jgi:hypothetical protein
LSFVNTLRGTFCASACLDGLRMLGYTAFAEGESAHAIGHHGVLPTDRLTQP